MKRHTTISIEIDLILWVKEKRINLSEFTSQKIIELMNERKPTSTNDEILKFPEDQLLYVANQPIINREDLMKRFNLTEEICSSLIADSLKYKVEHRNKVKSYILP